MPRKRFRPEEIIAKPREADVLLGQVMKEAEVVRALGVSEVTYRDELLERGIFYTLREPGSFAPVAAHARPGALRPGRGSRAAPTCWPTRRAGPHPR